MKQTHLFSLFGVWLPRIFAGALVTCVVLLLVARILVSTSFGHSLITNFVAKLAPAGQNIQLTGLSGDPLSAFEIDQIKVSDRDGVWLVADNIKISWKGLAVLSKRLEVTAADIDRVVVSRRPILAEQDSAEKPASSKLPFEEMRVERFLIARLELGEKIVPLTSAFSVAAGLNYGRATGSANLAITPLSGPDDRLMAKANWRGKQPPEIDVTIKGAKQGWLTSLLGLKETDTLKADISANGLIENWRANGLVQISDQTVLKLDGRTKQDLISVDATIDLALIPVPLPPELLTGLGTELNLNAAFNLASAEAPTVALSATTQTSSLQISGPLNAENILALPAQGLSVNLKTPKIENFVDLQGLRTGDITLAGTLTGTLPENADWKGKLRINQPKHELISAAYIEGPLTLTKRDQSLKVITDIKIRSPRSSTPEINKALGDKASLGLNASYNLGNQALAIKSAQIQTDILRVKLSGTDTDLKGDYQVALGTYELGADTAVSGTLNLVRPKPDTIRLQTNGKIIAAHIAGWQGLVSENAPLNFDLSASRAADGAILIDRLDLQNNLVSLAVESASYALDGAFALAGTGRATSVSNVDFGAISDLIFNINAQSNTQTGKLALEVTADEINQGDTALNTVELIWRADGALDSWTSEASLVAATPYGALNASLAPTLNGQAWSIGSLRAQLADMILEGTASGNLETLSSFNADINLGGQLPISAPVSDITANINAKAGVLTASVSAKTSPISGFGAGKANLDISGSLEALDTRIGWQSSRLIADRNRDLRLSMILASNVPAGQHALSIDSALGTKAIKTRAPIQISQQNEAWSVNGALSGFEGTLALEGAYSERAISLNADLSDISVIQLSDFLPILPISGTASGKAQLLIEGTKRDWAATADIVNISSDQADIAPVDANLQSRYEDGLLKNALTLSGEDTSIQASLDTMLDWRDTVPRLNEAALSRATLQGNGQIASFTALFLPPNISLSGIFNADLTASLKGEKLEAAGTLDLANGQLEHGDLGLRLNNVELQTALTDNQVIIKKIRATDRLSGTLTGEGQLSLDGSAKDELRLVSRKLQWVQRDDLTGIMSGNVIISKLTDIITVKGELIIDEATVNLDRLTGTPRPTLPVRFKTDPPAPKAKPVRTQLDVSILSDGNVLAKGGGLNTQLSLNARVRGSLNSPEIRGRAELERGYYTFATQRFDFADSFVTISPGEDPVELNIRAERSDGDVTAIISITGTPERPVIALSAVPALPEDEILSRILFGRDPDQLTPVQALRLASTLAGLVGGNGLDVLGRIEETLLLDRLDISETADGAAVLTTGKYLRPDVYVEVQNTVDSVLGVSIEWEPFDNVAITGATGSDVGQRITLRWQRDFDKLGGKPKASNTDKTESETEVP